MLALLTGLVYFIMARASLQLAFQQSNASPVWPPSGFAFAMVLLLGRRIAPGILLGAFAGNLATFLSNASCSPSVAVLLSGVIAVGNTGEALAGEILLKKFTEQAPLREVFRQPSGIFRFTVVVMLMCLVSSCVGTLSILVGGIIPKEVFRTAWLTWWTGDFSGVLLLTPLIVIWVLNPKENFVFRARYYYAEALMVFAATIVMTGIVFLDWTPHRFLYTRSFIMIPFFLYSVIRLNLREVITIIAVSCIIAIYGTANGMGPLSTFSMNESLLTVQLFVSIAIGTKLILWTIIYQLRESEAMIAQARNELEQRVKERTAALRESEEQFRKAFYGSPAAMSILDMQTGRIVDVNDAFLRLLGYAREDIIGMQATEKELFAAPGLVRQLLQDTSAKGFIKDRDISFIHKTGETGSGMFSAEIIHIKGHPSIVATIIDVTELKKAEEKFRRMVESAPDAIVIFDKEGGIVLVNSQMEHLFGYTREEMLGRHASMLLPDGSNEKHAAAIARYLVAPRMRTLGESMDIVCRRKDGTLFPVEISLSPLDTNEGVWISGAIRDITERKISEERLKNSNYRLVEAQRISRMGNWEWDIASNKLTWSGEMYRIFGVDPESFEPTYESFSSFIHPEDRVHFRDKFENTIRKPQTFVNYYRIIRPDGAVRVLERRGEVFTDEEGKAVKMAGTTQDVTERRETEEKLKAKSEELIELNYSLHRSNRELERMNAELSTFAYVASHDLQEPLRKIQTFASRILESEAEGLSTAGLDYLQRLHKSVQRLHVLLEDLLAYSRLNTGDSVFEKTDLNAILEEEVEECRDLYQEKKGSLVHDALPSIQAIPFQVHQLFHNLISNSLKFSDATRPPSLEIRCKLEEGTGLEAAGLSAHRRYYHLTFADNGIGFEPEYSQRIFEVFQRLHGRNSYPGTGIGLAICKRVAENHQGGIRAEGRLGEGAVFHVYFPESLN